MTRFLDHPIPSDFSPLSEPTIYLVPPKSTRYIFRRKRRDSEPVAAATHNVLVIDSSRQMIDFLNTYATSLELDQERHGCIDWSAVQGSYDGIEFKWYRHFSRTPQALRQTILEHDLLEFYANLAEKCGFSWQSTTPDVVQSTNQTLS